MKQFRQGDLLITKVNNLPEDLEKMEAENGNYIMAHSETGHHHVLPSNAVKAFQSSNPLIMFVVVKKPTQITHLRAFDTHKPINLDVGNYEFRRQSEYTPEGWRRVED